MFKKKPPIKVGDKVMDSWSELSPPKKAVVTRIKRSGAFASEDYYVRHEESGYESSYPRKRHELELRKPEVIELRNQAPLTFTVWATQDYITGFGTIPKDARCSAAKKENGQYVVYYGAMQCHMNASTFHDAFYDERYKAIRDGIERKLRAEKERLNIIKDEPRRSEWFDVIAKRDLLYMSGRNGKTLSVKEGDMIQMRALSDGTYEVDAHDEHVSLNEASATQNYERYDINDYATEWPRKKEDEDMSAELYGWFSDDEEDVVERRAREEKAKADARIAELEAQLKEKEKQFEVSRRLRVSEEYGIVAERHLWDVVIDVPTSWIGSRLNRGGAHSTEVITEGKNMAEAAMAAEAMAKGMNDEAYVAEIKYNRVLGAIK
jgi:hypothetical protein